MVYERFIDLLAKGFRRALTDVRLTGIEVEKIIRKEVTSGDPTKSTPIMLGAEPETEYNSTTTVDDAFINIIPPSGQYVYLMCITGNVGTDGDVVELQALCTDGVWRTVVRLKMLANTSVVKGFPNLKLDKIKVAGTEYDVEVGDGVNPRVRLVSRGTGPWEATIEYFCAE